MSSQSNLQTAYFFSADDLNANRRGLVSDAQVLRLRKMRRQSIPMAILALLALALAVGMGHDVPGVSLFMLVVTAYFAYMGAQFWLRFNRDSQSSSVATVRGAVTKRYFSGGRNRRYFLRVGAVEFVVMVYQYSAVTEGRSYRVYYAPITRTILSIEADD